MNEASYCGPVQPLRPVWPVRCLYIGWSDITYLWSQCDRHFVGEHIILCVVKWWSFVASFESNWISWLKKMSVLSLSYWESDVYWRQNNKYFANISKQTFPHKMTENSWYEEITSLSPCVYIRAGVASALNNYTRCSTHSITYCYEFAQSCGNFVILLLYSSLNTVRAGRRCKASCWVEVW